MRPDREKVFAVCRLLVSALLLVVAAVLVAILSDPRLAAFLLPDEHVVIVCIFMILPLAIVAVSVGSPALLVLGKSLPPKGELERLLEARSCWLRQWESEHRSFSSAAFIHARQGTRSAAVQSRLPEEGYLDRLTEIKSEGGWLPREEA